MTRRIFVVAVLAWSVAATTSAGPVLWGLSTSSPGHLYTIDTATGVATAGPTVSGATNTSLVGLEFYNGLLYATDVCGLSCYEFGSIDPSTGVFTTINNQAGSFNWHGLAADHQAGIFYTIDINDSNKLKSVTPTGVVTPIGSGNSGVDGRGMAFDDVNNVLYATGGDSLYRVDTTTGGSSLIGSLGLSTNLTGLAFDNTTGVLYLNSGDSGGLYTVDTSTGAATLVGLNGVTSIDGLAFQDDAAPVPEPGTLLLLGGGLLGLTRARRRAKPTA